MDRHGIEDPTEDTDYWLEDNDGRVNFNVNTRPKGQAQSPNPATTPPHTRQAECSSTSSFQD